MGANLVDKHEPDMLVVDLAHERLVTNILYGLVQPLIERDTRLGLSLLTLTSADEAADAVLERRPEVVKEPPERLRDRQKDWSGLDRLLDNLRAAFEHDYGWTPTMGKNRVMTPVQAVTYPNAGGSGGPEPISPAALGRAGAGRGSDAGEGVRVGLPDTVFYPHETLTGRYVLADPAKDLVVLKRGQPYITGHCTNLASQILREAPAARLDIRPVLATGPEAERDRDRTVWNVARRMVEYLDSGVHIINCSWACLTRDGKPPLVLERAVGMLTPTIMVVAAASNHGELIAANNDADPRDMDSRRRADRLPERFAPAFPAALPNVLAVGALDGDRPASFNPVVRTDDKDKLGTEALAPWIDVLAQGVDTIGAYFGSDSAPELIDVPVKPKKGEVATEEELKPKEFKGAAKWSGTSFAAAAVTGLIAARIKPGISAQDALDDLLKEGGGPVRPGRP